MPPACQEVAGMIGIRLATGNVASTATCVLVPLNRHNYDPAN
jgi:hypothetical protein